MGETISEEEVERVGRLLKREIQRAAARLIKVRRGKALGYANEQIEVMNENGDEEDQVFGEKIAAEVEKQLSYRRPRFRLHPALPKVRQYPSLK